MAVKIFQPIVFGNRDKAILSLEYDPKFYYFIIFSKMGICLRDW